MKGGKTPIHRQPWYPDDYHEDEHVKLLKSRRDYRTLTFYRHFLDRAWKAGGDLPADPEALAAVVEMPLRDVKASLLFCVGKLIHQEGERLYQGRVRRDLKAELEFRSEQSERGRLGGRPRKESGGFHPEKPTVFSQKSPPVPTPTPSPTPERETHGSSRLHGVSHPRSTPAPEPPPDEGHPPNGNGHDDAPERLDPGGFLDAVKLRLTATVPTQLHATWIRPLEAAGWEGDVFVLEAPTHEARNWCRANYGARIRDACRELGQDCRVRITVRPREPATVHNGAL